VFFVGGEGFTKFLYRIKEDTSGLEKVTEDPVTLLYDVSPDGKWLAAWAGRGVVVYPTEGGTPVLICSTCANRPPPDQPGVVTWSGDGRFLYFHDTQLRRTHAVFLRSGEALPTMPASGIPSPMAAAALPGAQLIPQERAVGGPDPSIYAFVRVTTHRNVYRIPLSP
jgi:hypothetical protein